MLKWLTVRQAAKRLGLETDEARDLILQRLPEHTARRMADGVTIGEQPYRTNLLNWSDDEGNVFTALSNGQELRLGQIVVDAVALDGLADELQHRDEAEEPAEAYQVEGAAPETLTPMKLAAIIERLGRRYLTLESALNRTEEWAKECRVPGRRGWYYLERIEAECRARYGGAAPAPASDLSPAAQLRRAAR